MNDEEYMLTTYDNPYNPFEEFEAWWKYDIRNGHDTCGLLAREANSSPIFSDEVNDKLTVEAMDYICAMEPMVYRKVTKADYLKDRVIVTMA